MFKRWCEWGIILQVFLYFAILRRLSTLLIGHVYSVRSKILISVHSYVAGSKRFITILPAV